MLRKILLNKLTVLLVLTLVVRILCVFIIGKVPCMESDYLSEGKNIVDGTSCVIYLSPLYSVLVYSLSILFDSIFYASSLIFIVSSTLVSYYIYSICKLWFNEQAANTSLLFALFIPNLTVSIAGYSHSVILGIALELAALFQLLIYFNKNTFKNLALALLFTILTICIRPELIVVIVPFYFMLLTYDIIFLKNRSFAKSIFAGVFFILLSLSIFMHKEFVKSCSINKETAGIFTDNTYSYFTFIHTYSIRYFNTINDQQAISASKPFIGSPEENQYSIPTAILKNPIHFAANILFNCKEILDNLAHPLFLPFYFYFFIGLLFQNPEKKNYVPLVLISGLFLLHMIPLVIFHVEIRYMQAFCVLFIILTSVGESLLKSKIYRNAVVCCTFVIFMIYLINNMNMVSLCV